MKYTSEQIEQINNSISIVDYAKQYLELEEIKGEHWCVCCFHDDVNASMSFNAEKNSYYCLGCKSGGYLINFVMQYHKLSFPMAIKHIIELSNLKLEEKEYSDVYEYLKKKNHKPPKPVIQRSYLPANAMNKYTKKPIEEWLREGVTQEVLDKYDVRYDIAGNAIVFPIHNEHGRILAIKVRTLYPNYNELGIKKYRYYQKIFTNDFLFGLWQNKKNIEDQREVIVVEAEKGVMILESYGYKNVVALSTSVMTSQQIDLLLSLKCRIVLALDKDVTKKDLCVLAKPLKLFATVECVYDSKNVLVGKESPYDKGKEVWQQLYSEKIIL